MKKDHFNPREIHITISGPPKSGKSWIYTLIRQTLMDLDLCCYFEWEHVKYKEPNPDWGQLRPGLTVHLHEETSKKKRKK